MEYQPPQHGIYDQWWNQWGIVTTTSSGTNCRSRLPLLRLFVPFPLIWMYQLVSNLYNRCHVDYISFYTGIMAWFNSAWRSSRTHPRRAHVVTFAVDISDTNVVDGIDDMTEYENDSTTEERHHDKFHDISENPSDDYTITEFDDDDEEEEDDTATMDVDTTEHHDESHNLTPSSIILKTAKSESKLLSHSTIQDFDRHRILGTGQFGQVWLVSEKKKSAATHNATMYALKVISKYDLIVTDEVDMIVREKNIMYQLTKEQQAPPHPFIAKLQATFQNDNFLFLLQEFCPGGELFNVMHTRHTNNNDSVTTSQIRLPVDQVAFYTLCIADALEYMHTQHSIVYRDLKPENIMLDSYGYPKLIDMGYAKRLTKEDDYMTYTFCGTPNYTAPEMIQLSSTNGVSFHVDHWALGILVHEMFYGTHPFNTQNNDMDQMELFHGICNDEYTTTTVIPSPENDSTPDHDSAVRTEMTDLIGQLLRKDPTQRLGRSILGGESIGAHPFFQCTSTHYNIDELRQQTIVAPWIQPHHHDITSSPDMEPDTTPVDWFQQQYPKLSKREKAFFDAF